MDFPKEVESFFESENIPVKQILPEADRHGLLFQLSDKLFLHLITYADMRQTNPGLPVNLSGRMQKQNKQVIHLCEDVWNTQNNLVKARLLALLGKRKRIHARQTSVVRLDKKQADDFLHTHHLQNSATAYYKYGLIHSGELVAVATFSKSRVMHNRVVPYRSFELVRFASKSGVTVAGGLGKLLNHFITNHHPAHLMTYADSDWSSGDSYKKLGFAQAGFTEPQLFYLHPEEQVRYYPHRLPASFADERELLKAGYLKIYNAGNSKWELFCTTQPVKSI
ncbi:MAG: hypothetical protein K1X81_07760 [Bacteroidia bacterium]|nr:hypothetical protein [Bacteroidia bacterium]